SDEGELKRFRAQLRHFRNLGIPAIPRPGRGTHITYTTEHVHQLWLALQLHALPLPPAAIAEFLLREWTQGARLSRICDSALKSKRPSILIVDASGLMDVAPLRFVSAVYADDKNFPKMFIDEPPRGIGSGCCLIMLSRGLRMLHAQLNV